MGYRIPLPSVRCRHRTVSTEPQREPGTPTLCAGPLTWSSLSWPHLVTTEAGDGLYFVQLTACLARAAVAMGDEGGARGTQGLCHAQRLPHTSRSEFHTAGLRPAAGKGPAHTWRGCAPAHGAQQLGSWQPWVTGNGAHRPYTARSPPRHPHTSPPS